MLRKPWVAYFHACRHVSRAQPMGASRLDDLDRASLAKRAGSES